MLGALLLAGVWASAQEEAGPEPVDSKARVITIDSSGGTQSGNLRFGPIRYRHPEPLGVVGTVQELRIRAPEAVLEAPEGVLISQAKGSRTATFAGGVEVTRGRVTANGPSLTYVEADGVGVLERNVMIEVAPAEEGGDVAVIDANETTFDVNLDRSVSRGSVVLEQGPQRAEAEVLTYGEGEDLARLSCRETRCRVVREGEDGPLVIEADEVRVLTQTQRLFALGSVTVTDGDITTEGSRVTYDDTLEQAEVVGRPARSVNAASGVTLESDRILQDVGFDYVEAIDASVLSDVPLEAFYFADEAVLDGVE
jgi:lipopolysaccharide export system protein LptA